jgi:ATP-binding cassette subfamily B protein
MSAVTALFREFAGRFPRHFALLFALLVAEGAAAALSVLAVVPLADYLLDPSLAAPSRITQVVLGMAAASGLSPGFALFGALFVGLHALKSSAEVVIRYAVLRIKYAVLGGLVEDALRTFFRARWSFFSGTDQGQLLHTLNREVPNIGDTLGALTMLLAQLVQLATYLAVPMWLNPVMTSTALGLALLFGLPFLLLHRLSYRLGQQNVETGAAYTSALNEVLQAARLVLGFGRQSEARTRTMAAYDGHVRATLRSQVLATAALKLYQPLAILAAVVAMGVAIQQQTRVSELAAVLWSLIAAVPVLSAVVQGNVSITNFLPSYEQLVALRQRATELQDSGGGRRFDRLERGLELRAVDFTYPGRAGTLKEVSLGIAKGQMVALVGESGSGKSTVADLVLGLQAPGRGEVLLDGISLGEWDRNSFRERVGYVPQDPLLFNASLRENLLWSRPQAQEPELWEALALANAEQFVRALPQGLDTVVGDRGLRLSGGQRQRIALARALVRRPELLILDEATSALDSESEQLIQQSIEKVAGRATLLVVAHRLSTVARADHVYVLSAGRVVEAGPFAELSARPGGALNAMLAAQAAPRPGA